MQTIYKVFIDYVTILFLFYVLVFWPQGSHLCPQPLRAHHGQPSTFDFSLWCLALWAPHPVRPGDRPFAVGGQAVSPLTCRTPHSFPRPFKGDYSSRTRSLPQSHTHTLTCVRTHVSTWTSQRHAAFPLTMRRGWTSCPGGAGGVWVDQPSLGGVSLAHFLPHPHSPALGPGAAPGGEAECGQRPRPRREEDGPLRPQLSAGLQGHFCGESTRYFLLKPASSACCLGAGRGWLAGEGAMHGPRASPRGFEGLRVWGLRLPG